MVVNSSRREISLSVGGRKIAGLAAETAAFEHEMESRVAREPEEEDTRSYRPALVRWASMACT